MKLNKTIKTLGFTILMLMPMSGIVFNYENNQLTTGQVDYKITDTQDADQTIVFKDTEHYEDIKPVFEEAHLIETYEYANNEYNIYLSLSTEFHDRNSGDKDFVIAKSTNYDLGIFISTKDKENWDSVDFEAYIDGPKKSYGGSLKGEFLNEQNENNQRWMMFETSFRVLPEEIFDSNGILEDITKQDVVINLIDNESNTNIIENQEISKLPGFEDWTNIVKSKRKGFNNQQHYLKENYELGIDFEEKIGGQINIDIEADIEIKNGSGKAPLNLPTTLNEMHKFYGLVADVYYDVIDHNDLTVEGNSVTIEKINLEYAFQYDGGGSGTNLVVDSNIDVFNWGLKGSVSNYYEYEKDRNNVMIFTSSDGEEYNAEDLEIGDDLYGFEFSNMEYIYLNQSKFLDGSESSTSSVYYADYQFLPINKTHEIINYVLAGISGAGLLTGTVLMILTYRKQKINKKNKENS